MKKDKILKKIDIGLRVFVFAFICFLITITVYEVHVTGYLKDQVDSVKKWDAMHTKYSDFGIHNFIDEGPLYHPGTATNFIFSLTVIDEDEEQDSEREKYDKGWYK